MSLSSIRLNANITISIYLLWNIIFISTWIFLWLSPVIRRRPLGFLPTRWSFQTVTLTKRYISLIIIFQMRLILFGLLLIIKIRLMIRAIIYICVLYLLLLLLYLQKTFILCRRIILYLFWLWLLFISRGTLTMTIIFRFWSRYVIFSLVAIYILCIWNV